MEGIKLLFYIFITLCLFGTIQTCDSNGLKMCIAQADLTPENTASACRGYNRYKACTNGLYSGCSVSNKDFVQAVYSEELAKLGCETDPAYFQCPTRFSTKIDHCLRSNLYSGSYSDDTKYCPWFKKVLDCAVDIVNSNCGTKAGAAYKITFSYQKLTSRHIHYCPQAWNPFKGRTSAGDQDPDDHNGSNMADIPKMSLFSLSCMVYIFKKAV